MKEAPVRHLVEYAAYLAVKGVVRALPHATARAAGRRIGALAWRVLRRHRRIAEDNLAHALPELDAAERRQIARGAFEHFGMAMTDSVSAGRFDLEALCRRLELVGWENLQEAEARSAERTGGGLLVLTAHLGLWEMAAYPTGIYGGPLQVIGRPLDNPWLDRELVRSRERFGNELVSKHGAVRRMLKALARGHRVGLLIDQRARPGEGIWVPFFGRPAYTTPVLARLSLRTGTPVVSVYGSARPGGRYRVEVASVIDPEDVTADGFEGDGAVVELTRRYMEDAERMIRRHPDQWLWMHERWKVPRGESPPVPGEAAAAAEAASTPEPAQEER